jgi:hypothetical protein
MTLVDFLAQRCGFELVERRVDAVLAAAALRQVGGGFSIVVERTYRPGLHLIQDATAMELEVLRQGDLWDLWNSDRGIDLEGVV